MIDFEQPPDAPKAIAFEVQLQRHRFRLRVVAERTGRRRVLATAQLTLVALVSSAGEAGFDLPHAILAMGTRNHVCILNHQLRFRHSPICTLTLSRVAALLYQELRHSIVTYSEAAF